MRDATLDALLSNKSHLWYTPSTYISAARQVLGDIELDPASDENANKRVRAVRIFTEKDDGLSQVWRAETVWCNPPYCKGNQERWSRKLIAEYEAGHVKAAILLVSAATDTQWFHGLWPYPICFAEGRINFISPTDPKRGNTHGSVFVYFGPHREKFMEVFSQFGAIVTGVYRKQLPTLPFEEDEQAAS